MTYTDEELLVLLEDLRSVGQSETPREELHRLVREWAKEEDVEEPAKRAALIQKKLGLPQDGIYGFETAATLSKWSLPSFFLWMEKRGKKVQILKILRRTSGHPKLLVLYKDYAVDFFGRKILPSSQEDLKEGNLTYWEIFDYLPSEAWF